MADRNGKRNVAVAARAGAIVILTLQTPINVVQGSGSSRSYSTSTQPAETTQPAEPVDPARVSSSSQEFDWAAVGRVMSVKEQGHGGQRQSEHPGDGR